MMIKRGFIDQTKSKTGGFEKKFEVKQDDFLRKRSSPPTDSTGNIHDDDKMQEEFSEISEKFTNLSHKARIISDFSKRKHNNRSVIEFLNTTDPTVLEEAVGDFFGDFPILAKSGEKVSKSSGFHGSEDFFRFYNILEKPIVNLKWRSESKP